MGFSTVGDAVAMGEAELIKLPKLDLLTWRLKKPGG
jgi:hypothetical protein